MIPFNAKLLTTKHVYLKACTTALGGSISIVDTDRSYGDTEIYKKVKIPLAVARNFNKIHEVSRYLKPVLCAVVFYDGHAVTLERHPQGNNGKETTKGLFGDVKWESETEKSIERQFLPMVANGQWFTDGIFVYNFNSADSKNIINMSSDGKFKSVPVEAIKFADLSLKDTPLETRPRTCLDFTASDGTRATSPPIWKQLSDVGNRQMSRHAAETEVDPDDTDCQFDRIDEFLAVNLGFALKAATELCDVFGYDVMEPLALDELMIQLHTVNLPKTSPHVKRTYDTGMKFTHAVAWLVGLNNNVDTLDSYKVLRSLLKYLTTKGVYYKTAMSDVAIYKQDMQNSDVPLMTMDDALNSHATIDSLNPLFVSGTRGTQHTAIGSLYAAE